MHAATMNAHQIKIKQSKLIPGSSPPMADMKEVKPGNEALH
jgi:hypothetical protein